MQPVISARSRCFRPDFTTRTCEPSEPAAPRHEVKTTPLS
jgi:hypothetical protein